MKPNTKWTFLRASLHDTLVSYCSDKLCKIRCLKTTLLCAKGINPVGILNRTSADYMGPLPTIITEPTDPWLILAWIVLFLSIIYWFTRSNLFWTLIENIRNTWREAEAQHQHAD